MLAHNRDELIDALTRRRYRLGYSQIELDERAGFQLGYTGKLENPAGVTARGKRWGRSCIHPMFDLWIGSLGIGLAVVPLRHVRRPRKPVHAQLVLPLPEPAANMGVASDHGGTVGSQPTGVNTKRRVKTNRQPRRRKRRAA